MDHMPLPHWLARVNVNFSNRFMRAIAARLPWFVVLEHVGRKSGTVRRTAIMAFHRGGDRWILALIYGTEAQWLQNVQSAGGDRIQSRGRWIDVGEPRRFRDPSRSEVPWLVRPFLALLRVSEFVELREKR